MSGEDGIYRVGPEQDFLLYVIDFRSQRIYRAVKSDDGHLTDEYVQIKVPKLGETAKVGWDVLQPLIVAQAVRRSLVKELRGNIEDINRLRKTKHSLEPEKFRKVALPAKLQNNEAGYKLSWYSNEIYRRRMELIPGTELSDKTGTEPSDKKRYRLITAPDTEPYPQEDTWQHNSTERSELAIQIRYFPESSRWICTYSSPKEPAWKCKREARVPDVPAGDDVFHVLFGDDKEQMRQTMAFAFDRDGAPAPTFKALRVLLTTDDRRLHQLPWNNISYEGTRLADLGWTVELQPWSQKELGDASHFPNLPTHTCLFPGRVLILHSPLKLNTAGPAHVHSLGWFFQRNWEKEPDPLMIVTCDQLKKKTALGGDFPLIYLYGAAEPDGFEMGDGLLSWSDLRGLLERENFNKSILFLNLVGPRSCVERVAAELSSSAPAVLLHHSDIQERNEPGATAAESLVMEWLKTCFVEPRPLPDPVTVFFKQRKGRAFAWTRYSEWATLSRSAPTEESMVNVLLDRSAQRNRIAEVKADMLGPGGRLTSHFVAFGTPGNRVHTFPETARAYLVRNLKDREQVALRRFQIDSSCVSDDIDRIVTDELKLQLAPGMHVTSAMLMEDAMASADHCLLLLGWTLKPAAEHDSLQDGLFDGLDDAKETLRGVAAWVHLLTKEKMEPNVKIISILTIEIRECNKLEDTENRIGDIKEWLTTEKRTWDSTRACEILNSLTEIPKEELMAHYFNTARCKCPEELRDCVAELIMGGLPAIPYDMATDTICWGENHGWATLKTKLEEWTRAGLWPVSSYTERIWEE